GAALAFDQATQFQLVQNRHQRRRAEADAGSELIDAHAAALLQGLQHDELRSGYAGGAFHPLGVGIGGMNKPPPSPQYPVFDLAHGAFLGLKPIIRTLTNLTLTI